MYKFKYLYFHFVILGLEINEDVNKYCNSSVKCVFITLYYFILKYYGDIAKKNI